MPKPVVISIASIDNKFDVRRGLDDDRILFFAQMIDAGETLPPVDVIKNPDVPDGFIFIDGRHRAAAYSFLGRSEIEANIVPRQDVFEMFGAAMRSNYGGPKPPTRADIEYTIRRMIEEGATNTKVYEILDFIPKSALRKYIENVKSSLAKVRLKQAIDMVADGASIIDAATKAKVEIEALREAIGGKGRTKKDPGSVAAEMKALIARVYKGAALSVYKRIEHIIRQIEDGELNGESGRKAVAEWEKVLTGQLGRIADWRARVNQVDPKRRAGLAMEVDSEDEGDNVFPPRQNWSGSGRRGA